MHIFITGAAGMIGRKLTERLVKDGALNGRPIERLSLHDIVRFPGEQLKPGERPVKNVDLFVSDLSTPGEARKVLASRPDVIFHLAGVVSAEAELDFDKGYAVNLDGTRARL
jgi:nucleoside-diphosphate-sugar epimerase